MTVSEARTRMMHLQIERIDALELGVDPTSTYVTRLEAAIADAKSDYIAGSVAEIAALVADLGAAAAQDLTVFSN
ncbi:MAG: hypothetical protein QOG15_2445 [Solirubrobacteraceae bacterium]|jgi:hypothetical protein|nr:hypothetical protein [Solirubrobacteraceae bacterium]